VLNRVFRPGNQGLSLAIFAALYLAAAIGIQSAASAEPLVKLAGQMPSSTSTMRPLGALAANKSVSIALALPLRNQDELAAALQGMYDPKSPEYHHFLSSNEFENLYSPTQADYYAVEGFAAESGLRVTGTHANRLILDVTGPAATVERAFHVNLLNYAAADGKVVFAPDSDPSVPLSISDKIQAVVGLDNTALVHPFYKLHQINTTHAMAKPMNTGSGQGGTMIPSDIRKAYNLDSTALAGAGQSIALFELDGYTSQDIESYESQFGIPNVTLTNELVDGWQGEPGDDGGDVEVTLDIELAMAMSPSINNIYVYEAPNNDQALLDEYSQIADDDFANQVSSSWGTLEIYNAGMLSAENSIFEEMAAKGQSFYSAAGDHGAYDNGSNLTVNDPASQPYACGVGGTYLTLSNAQAYVGETTWDTPSEGEGGGGGESVEWTKPSWQTGYGLSPTMRDVPDVCLDSDPNSGYLLAYGYAYGGTGDYEVGGTSCAAPLWASFTALVNEQRATNGLTSPLGFPNPALYELSEGPDYANDFHDIADNSNNLYYTAVPGYDDATGLGSFNGINLLNDLSSATPPSPNPQAAPTGLTAASAGPTSASLTWTAAAGATSYYVLRSATQGGPYLKIGAPSVAGYGDSGLTTGTTYYYVVTAKGPDGISPNSAAAHTAPAVTPGSLTATTVSSSAITLSWAACTGATGYNILRGSAHGGPYTSVGTSTTTSYTNSGLSAGTTYYYVITATTHTGTTPDSNEAHATTLSAAPTGLTATAAGSMQINLSWTASTGATGYNILRGTKNGGPYSSAGTSSSPSFSNTGLSGGTAYYYVVQATNAGGASANSAVATATTAPAVPSGVSAIAVSSTQINLSWSGVAGATGYNVMHGANGGPYTLLVHATSDSYSNTGLAANTTYYYVVQATTSTTTSADSGQASATSLAPTPASLVATAVSTSQINLSWSASAGATGYVVLRGSASGGPYTSVATPTTTTWDNAGLSAGTAYYYVVESSSTHGSSPNSNVATAKTVAAAPTSLSAAAASSTLINLSWTVAAGATSYDIMRGAAHGGPYKEIGTTTAHTYSDSTASAATAYYYVVTAVDAGGTSADSNEANATTPMAAPTGLVAHASSSSQVGLTWTAYSGATSYKVLRGTVSGGPYSTQVGTCSTAYFTNTALSASTIYYYVVEAVTAAGTSPNSAQAGAETTVNAPSAVAGLIATANGNTQINLSWTATAGAVSYLVLRGAVHGGPYSVAGSASATSYANTGLAASTTYYYVIEAVNSGGDGPYSNEANATTK
jgi:kumamolisin